MSGSCVSAMGGVPSESDHPRFEGSGFMVSDFGERVSGFCTGWSSFGFLHSMKQFRVSSLDGVPSESDHPGFRFQDAGCISFYFGDRLSCFCTGRSTE